MGGVPVAAMEDDGILAEKPIFPKIFWGIIIIIYLAISHIFFCA